MKDYALGVAVCSPNEENFTRKVLRQAKALDRVSARIFALHIKKKISGCICVMKHVSLRMIGV